VTSGRSARRGAYGLRLTGVEDAYDVLVPAPDDWQPLELSTTVGDELPEVQWVGSESALLRLRAGGQVAIDWTRGKAVFTLPQPVTAAGLVHPYLATVAAVAAHRDGREGFHAGAVVAGAGAWVVIGEKGAGKSSLLALLALRGHAVLADDVVILDASDRALAGPRFVDLRSGAAEQLGVGESVGVLGTRERYRVPIGPVPAATPLRGFVVLAWGDEPTVTRVPAARRLAQLYEHRIARLEPADAQPLLELSTLPMYALHRPPDWTSADLAAELLLATLD
jgi:hypothetical protein